MNRKARIAAVILTLNEETTIQSAITSVSWCDEVIVLDSGSTDSTCEIALANHANLFIHKQDPPFLITEQRNWAIKNCNIESEWILFLDADEIIGPELKEEIIEKLSGLRQEVAYELAPRYWFMGRWLRYTQGFPNWHPRIVKKGLVMFQGGVWESFTGCHSVGRMAIPYEHYSFSKGLEDWVHKHIRYARWEAHSVVDFIDTGSVTALRTKRSLSVRQMAARLWPLRPLLRFFEKYLFRLGILDGWQGLVFCLMMSMYELFVVIFIITIRRESNGEPL